MVIFQFIEIFIITIIVVFNISATSYILKHSEGYINLYTLGITNMFTLFSLIIAGFGMMGIQLINVNKRKKEIGLCMAIGATKRHIKMMILIDSIKKVIVPMILGLFIANFITPLIAEIISIDVTINVLYIIMSFGIIMLLVLLTGLYPAILASSMEPIDAMGKTQGLR